MKSEHLMQTFSTVGERSKVSNGIDGSTSQGVFEQQESSRARGHEIKNREFNNHKIKQIKPIFRLKIEGNQRRGEEHLRTDYSSIDKNISIRSVKINSGQKSQDRHHLKPSQVPKVTPQVAEFTSDIERKTEEKVNKKDQNLISDGQSQKHEEKSTLKKTGENKARANTFVKQGSFEKQCCHGELGQFMEEVTNKISLLAQRMTSIEHQNAELRSKIIETNKMNQQKCERISKLQVDKGQLETTQQKWETGKEKLRYLYREVMNKVQTGKKDKQNLGKEECLNYFEQRSKQKQPQSSNSSKKKLLERLHLRVEKS